MIISIGTAQLGINYGISNLEKNKLKFTDFKKIVNFGQKNGVFDIDTAFNYGDAHEKISKINLNNLKITTKVFLDRKDILNQLLIIKKNLKKFLKKNELSTINTLLIHNPSSIDLNFIKEINIFFSSLKGKYIDNFGISIYAPEELIFYSKILKLDEIQVPFNIFDRRFSKRSLIDLYTSNKYKISIRSVFLQGLLLMNKKKQISLFPKNEKLFIKFDNYLKKINLDPYSACINLALSQSWAYKLVIGFNNFDQFYKLINHKYTNDFDIPKNLSSNDKKLINPSEWNV